MDPERVAAVLRPRRHWEAIDLGFTMARAWWRPVWGAWVLCVLPVQLLIWGVLGSRTWWPLLLIWWLKPWFDRVPLYVLSRALFGATPRPSAVLRALPSLLKVHPAALLWGRFEPARSLHLPVWQLEGLSGTEGSRRRRLLARTVETPAGWLTLGCLGLELVLFIGALALAGFLLPEVAGVDLEHLLTAVNMGEASGKERAWVAACQLFALGLVEPLYVAGGFALYINRRTVLEGWDIEVSFRRLARRLTAVERPTPKLGPLVALLLTALASPAVLALDSGIERDPAAVVAEVLAEEDFGTTITETRYTWPWLEELLGEGEDGPLSCAPETTAGAGTVAGGAAGALELVFWLLLALGLAALGVWGWRQLQERGPRSEDGRVMLPDLLVGHDALPEVLPDDIPSAARARWAAGEHATALGLLYAGALLDLVSRHGVDLPRAATEGDCLRVVQARPGGELAGWFAGLTRAWLQTAYAHRPPPAADFERLATEWPRWFAGVAP